MRIEKIRSVMVALVYRGGGLREPSSHVARIPPELVKINSIAMAVALLVCGAALLAIHVFSVGATVLIPGIEKNRDPYCTLCFAEPKSNSQEPCGIAKNSGRVEEARTKEHGKTDDAHKRGENQNQSSAMIPVGDPCCDRST
jgi:hypothetical protein